MPPKRKLGTPDSLSGLGSHDVSGCTHNAASHSDKEVDK